MVHPSPLQAVYVAVALLFLLLVATSQGRRLVIHLARALLNGKTPLRWLAGLLAGVLPPVIWTLSFKLARFIPHHWRPEIHTQLLPILESILVSPSGIIFFTILLLPATILLRSLSRTRLSRTLYPLLIISYPALLKLTNKVATTTSWTACQDVLAWIFYGVLHFLSPFLVGLWLWLFAPEGVANVYGLTLGLQNLSGLVTHLVFPNAAPWYYDVYNVQSTVPTYDFPGNPAGLVRVDRVLGTELYSKAFRKSPVVFGALPSLHAASAVCASLFVARYSGFPGKLIMILYSLMMFWSTQYLHHHFAIDLVVGTFYSLMAFLSTSRLLMKLEARHEVEGRSRGVERILGRCYVPPLPTTSTGRGGGRETSTNGYRRLDLNDHFESYDQEGGDEEKALMLRDLSASSTLSPHEFPSSSASSSSSLSAAEEDGGREHSTMSRTFTASSISSSSSSGSSGTGSGSGSIGGSGERSRRNSISSSPTSLSSSLSSTTATTTSSSTNSFDERSSQKMEAKAKGTEI